LKDLEPAGLKNGARSKIQGLLALLALLPLSAEVLAQSAPLILKLPPAQTNVIAVGMGNAVGADGTLFNATAFNPALLERSPHGVEAFVLGLNVSNDFFGVIDYVNHVNYQADQIYYDLNNGLQTSNSQEVNDGLNSIQDMVTHLTSKALQAGAGLNIAVKYDEHWGFQVYNSTHAFAELWRGNLTNSLLAIPLPYTSASSAAVSAAVTVLGGDLQNGINNVLTPSQQSSVQTDINNLKNGSEPVTTFVQNVSQQISGIDPNALKQALLNSLLNDLATLTALLYSDTVFMGTYSLQPFKEVPGLTVAGNLKLVNRHFAYEALTFTSKDLGGAFGSDFKQSTTRWGLDFGCLYEVPNLPLDLGLSIQDLLHQGASIKAVPGSLVDNFMTDPAPTVVNLSVSYHPLPGLRVNGEVDDLLSDTSFYADPYGASRIKLGASYFPVSFLNLRAGFGDQNLSAGLGFIAGIFGFDYSYGVDDLSQSYNHYVQMRFVF
jgi:hypothetical protein